MVAANQARRLQDLFEAAIASVEPGERIRYHLVARDGSVGVEVEGRRLVVLDRGPVWLVAAGKAACGMAAAAVPLLAERLRGGMVSSLVKPRRPLAACVQQFEASHPVPDAGSVAAGRAAWRIAGRASRRGGTVLVLLSGGASSLLALPAEGISLKDKVTTTQLLLRAGAGIREVNAVRKHLSRIKGGGLRIRAGRARVVSLLLSDVIGNSPEVIGSGPTASDPTTFGDALRILDRLGLRDRVPPAVRRRLDLGRHGRIPETLKPGALRSLHVVVGDIGTALQGAAMYARRIGFQPKVLTDSLQGDSREAAGWFAEKLVRSQRGGHHKVCFLAGGETTVEVRGSGKGGRNQEFALALAQRIAGCRGLFCLSAGTDGVDGLTDAAGAFVDGTTIARARRVGLDPGGFLERNDSYGFFSRLGDLFRPGPTGTNVMDIKIALTA